jgi:hypothetical protein
LKHCVKQEDYVKGTNINKILWVISCIRWLEVAGIAGTNYFPIIVVVMRAELVPES